MTVVQAVSRQIERLTQDIYDAEDVDRLHELNSRFHFVRDCWRAAGYGDKVAQFPHKIAFQARKIIEDEKTFLRGERKHSRIVAPTLFHIQKLEELIDICS